MERTLATLRIGELAHRTGVGVPTLRAWESRYRLLRPSRTVGGQRLYSLDDEARVREVLRMVAAGSAVGAAARLVADSQSATQARSFEGGGGQSAVAISEANPEYGDAPQVQGAPGRGAIGRASSATTVIAVDRPARLSAGSTDNELLAVIHSTTRAIVHAATPADVVSVLAGFVRQTGASVVHAQIDDAVLPVDLSFGEGAPLLPRAEPFSVARLTLEQALPALVEDARRLVDLLRRAETRGPGPSPA